jgi:hypothetical protein
MTQDEYGATPDLDALLRWADRSDPYQDLTIPIMIDANAAFSSQWMGESYPFNMIIDPDGRCRYKSDGYAPSFEATWAGIFDDLILEFTAP